MITQLQQAFWHAQPWYFVWFCVQFIIPPARVCSGSHKVGARKIARCHFQVPVLKVRSQFRSQLKKNYKEPIFSNRNCGWLHVPLPVSCINGLDFFVQMLMSVLYYCFSFRFHHQKQKDVYNIDIDEILWFPS